MDIGELSAYNYLQGKGYKVIDATQEPEYWAQDIDLIAKKDGKEITIEVKWDSIIAKTGNLFVETLTDIDKGKQGWFQFCKADLLYYGDAQKHIFYVIKMSDLREYVENHKTLAQRKAPDRNYRHELTKVSNGILVPIKDLSQEYNVQIIYLNYLK